MRSARRHLPTSAHDVALRLVGLDLVAGQPDLSAPWDALPVRDVGRHGSALTRQQRLAVTATRQAQAQVL